MWDIQKLGVVNFPKQYTGFFSILLVFYFHA